MHIDFLLEVFKEKKDSTAIVFQNEEHSYEDLLDKIEEFRQIIRSSKIKKGSSVSLEGDFSPNSIALLLALIENECIIIPLTNSFRENQSRLLEISKVKYLYRVDEKDNVKFEKLKNPSVPDYYTEIRIREKPGLVLFTSGTSGEPKAAVHDFSLLLEKFKTRRNAMRTLNFLLFDHWGGLNTLFHILSNGGTVIATRNRAPENVCRLIEKHRIELLPASPTFLNLLLLSESYKSSDLSSLRIISYGTEPMPKITLDRIRTIFPEVRLLQTYGLIEVGVLRSQSENNNSLWVRVGGEGYQTRIVEGILQIKAESAMLGYLNASSPFTDDGWFVTGDEVLQKGDYIKILGRKSEIINVGGEKVYPVEVEDVIKELDNIAEVTVYGETNPIIGRMICADVQLVEQEGKASLTTRLKAHCKKRLQRYKIPVKVNLKKDLKYSNRFKKKRVDS